MADNVASALCYGFFFVTGIIFLVLAPYNKNRLIKFHAFQAIFFSLAFIIIRVALGRVFWMMGVLGAMGYLMVMGLVGLFFFIVWLYVILSTYQGKMVVLPVVGQLARQQAGL